MATHHQGSPEKRYVQLHRTIENGQTCDAVWRELCTVSYRLGYISEAIRSVSRVKNAATRQHLERWLTQKGVLEQGSGVHPAQKGKDGKSPYSKPAARGHLKGSSLQEEVFDAVSYLFLEHVPFTVMALTLMFPLVVGLGGMFTAGTEFWIFPAIALVPVLCIAMLVGSLAQQILLESSQGYTDPPRIPEFQQLVRRSALFLQAALASALLLLLPGVLMTELMGVNGLPLLIAGAILFPFALALCLTRNDLRGLLPTVLIPTILRVRAPWIGATIVTWTMFMPAVIALHASEGSALFLRLSLIGPLGIAPLFISARLVGRILYLSRDAIEDLMWTSPNQIDAEINDPTVETYTAGRAERRRRKASGVTPTVSNKQRKRRRRVDRLDAPAHPEQRRAARPNRPAARPKAPVKHTRPSVSIDEVDAPVFGQLDDLPAGFNVLQGAERINAGAAARQPDQP